MHSNNIHHVQNETLKILEETQTILPKTQELEKMYKEILDNEKLKLNHLEYVIAVVGTVKAGKSTTINAIVGKEVLPHRTEAMTSLPTLITHTLGQVEPILKLPKIEPLEMLLTDIKQKLKENIKSNFLKTDEGQEFKKIITSNFSFSASYSGEKNIFEFLRTLNDMMRIAKELDLHPPFKEFENVDQLPRIEVEFKYLKGEEAISQARLSLLDTPGTNEYKHSEYLNEILTSQLKKASSVVLVINYPQISSSASGDLQERFSQTVDFVGKEHMFVFANQIDNVDKKDADPEKIKNNIAENKLDGNISKDHVFPISAKKAFFSQLGLTELEKHGKIDLELPWIEDFGKTILGSNLEDEEEKEEYKNNVEKVRKRCYKAWENSLFQTTLNVVIANAHAKASFQSIQGTLNKLAQIINELQNSFKIQESALSQTIEKLKKDIDTLQKDIEQMKSISQKLTQQVGEHLKEIKAELDDLMNSELSTASAKIMTIFEEQEDKLQLENKEKEKVVKNDQGLLKIFFKSIIIGKKSFPRRLEELKQNGTLTFREKKDASEFMKSMIKIAQQLTLKIIEDIETKFIEKSTDLLESINDSINSELEKVIEDIKSSLGTNINLEFPKIAFQTNNLNVKKNFNGMIKTKKIERTQYVEQDGFWGSVKRTIDCFDCNWGLDEKTIYEDEIIIVKKDLEEALKKLFDTVLKTVLENSHTLYTNTISLAVKTLLDNLIVEIENYREEKLAITKKREADTINTKDEIVSAQRLQKTTARLQKRTEVAQTMLLKEMSHA